MLKRLVHTTIMLIKNAASTATPKKSTRTARSAMLTEDTKPHARTAALARFKRYVQMAERELNAGRLNHFSDMLDMFLVVDRHNRRTVALARKDRATGK